LSNIHANEKGRKGIRSRDGKGGARKRGEAATLQDLKKERKRLLKKDKGVH